MVNLCLVMSVHASAPDKGVWQRVACVCQEHVHYPYCVECTDI